MVFFIGHSVEMDDDVYLAPIEAELDKPATLIPLKWFYEQLAKCKVRQKVLVLDVNRYNQTFGQERPGGGEMGPKLDAMLKEPPAGVQVWSSCIVKQSPMRRMKARWGFPRDLDDGVSERLAQGKIQAPRKRCRSKRMSSGQRVDEGGIEQAKARTGLAPDGQGSGFRGDIQSE